MLQIGLINLNLIIDIKLLFKLQILKVFKMFKLFLKMLNMFKTFLIELTEWKVAVRLH